MGKIISLKLGRRFCPDYRKGKTSTYCPIPPDAKKILIIDDKIDWGDTFRWCLQDLLRILKPESDYKTLSSTYQTPNGIEVRFFAFLDSGDSPEKEHYKLFESLDYDFPWGNYSDPFKSEELRRKILDAGFSWSGEMIKLFDELSAITAPRKGDFYQNRPIDSQILLKFEEEPAEIQHSIYVERPLNEQTFLDACKEHNLIVIGKKRVTTNDDNKSNSFGFNIEDDSISLRFEEQNLRTFDDMCRNCEFKKIEKRNICQTCNKYVRSLELLERIIYVIRKVCGLKEVRTELKNKCFEVDLGSKAIEDLKRKNAN